MTDRDALEILVNLHYLIENHSTNPALVRTLVRQAVGSLDYLIEHCTNPEEGLERAA